MSAWIVEKKKWIVDILGVHSHWTMKTYPNPNPKRYRTNYSTVAMRTRIVARSPRLSFCVDFRDTSTHGECSEQQLK